MAKNNYEPKNRAELLKMYSSHAELIRMYEPSDWRSAYEAIRQSIDSTVQARNLKTTGTLHEMLFPGPKMKFVNASRKGSVKSGEKGSVRRAGRAGKW